jgi:hypothetical protein
LGAIDKPPILVPLCVALVWLVGTLFVAPWLARRVARGRNVFVHPERGLLTDRIREAVRGGSLGHSMDAHAANLMREMAQRLKSEVWWEVARIRDLLTLRRREMDWLKLSLRDFQTVHGMSIEGPPRLDPRLAQGRRCRHSLERDEDLREMLALNPPIPDRFRSAQAERKPFTGWDQKFCDTFLHPLTFLEDLSQEYERTPSNQFAAVESTRADRAEKLIAAVRQIGSFSPGMQWSSRDGGAAAHPENYCYLPQDWRSLPAVMDQLHALGWMEARVFSTDQSDRAYLLKLQFGLQPARLRGEESA